MKEEIGTQRDSHKRRQRKLPDALIRDLRQIAARASSGREDASPITGLERQISLSLDEIDHSLEVHKNISREITRSEAEINSELMQMEARTPRYSPYRFPEREKFQRQLHNLGQEKRRLSMTKHQQLRELYQRLWSLWEKHAMLDF